MNYFQMANEFYLQGNYKKALKYYRCALDKNHNEITCLYNSAVCLIRLKQYEEAIPVLEKVISMMEQSKYYFNLAYCHYELKNNKKALLYFNNAWALDNDDTECERAINTITHSLRVGK